jgi:putative two-component system response regulator
MLLRTAEDIALTHHERWDGSGYPGGLAGAEIPLPGRITHVADVFDAMTHPHGEPAHERRDEAIGYIREESGLALDPDVVAAFTSLAKRDRML